VRKGLLADFIIPWEGNKEDEAGMEKWSARDWAKATARLTYPRNMRQLMIPVKENVRR